MRDLQAQIARREKQAQQLSDDVSKGRDKIERLLVTIDELQAEETRSQLAAKRAERDVREEREKALRLERELEGWKGLRMERSGGREWASGSIRATGSRRESGNMSGLGRMASDSKGFL